MKNTELYGTSNTELVTISRAEYEELQAQSQRVSALEKHVDILLEALRLARHKQFGASSEKCDEPLTEQLSFLFNEVEVFAQPEKEEGNRQRSRRIDFHEIIVLERSGTFQHYFVWGVLP